jgi:2-keto-4-pentenoate hydratase/2-oxohepta-3-ene-1,7-dioic acid hydratase in catechol pathway
VVKTEALDQRALRDTPIAERLVGKPDAYGERALDPSPAWLCPGDSPLRPQGLTFVGLRAEDGSPRFTLLLGCEAEQDRLTLLPLAEGESPLHALAQPERRAALQSARETYAAGAGAPPHGSGAVALSLSQAVTQGLLASPLPAPAHVYAVAANFPSHLVSDLALKQPELPRALAASRPRVFVKYPPTPPPDEDPGAGSPFTGLIGPYGAVRHPSAIRVPGLDPTGRPGRSPPLVDYEVEIGVVIGTDLIWEAVRDMTDAELFETVAGYVLVGDTKFRNPQIVGKIAAMDQPPPPGSEPYLLGDGDLDEAIGYWHPETAQWWSYAASWGDCTSIGPFFIAADPADVFTPRVMLAARTYAPADRRGAPFPDGHTADTFYVRQATLATDGPAHPDPMLWSVPAILRAILEPGSALSFLEGGPRLERGDVVSLGTPGGTVITSVPHRLADIAEDLVFWRSPRDWHDSLIARTGHLYLRHGDEVFYWAEGLGFQRLAVQGGIEPGSVGR